MARLELIVDPTKAQRGYQRASQSAQQFNRSARRTTEATSRTTGAFNRMGESLRGVRGALASAGAALGGAAFLRSADRALTRIQEIERAALALGESTRGIQELNFAFRQFNLQPDDVNDALGTISDRAQDAVDGMESLQEDFGLLGISVDELRGKSPSELFELLAASVADVEDPTRRAAGVVRTFGDDLGRRLLPLLIEGEQGLNRYRQEANELNSVLGADTVSAGADAAEELNKLRAIFDAQFNRAVAENADEFSQLADVIASDEFKSGLDALTGLFSGLAEEIGRSVEQLGNLAALFQGEFNGRSLLDNSIFGVAGRVGGIDSISDRLIGERPGGSGGGSGGGGSGGLPDGGRISREGELGKIRAFNFPGQLETLSELGIGTVGSVGPGNGRNQLQQIERRAELLQERSRLLREIQTPQQRYNEQVQRVERLQSEGLLTQEQASRALEEYREQLKGAKTASDDYAASVDKLAKGIETTVTDALTDSIIEWESWEETASNALNNIARQILRQQVVSPLVQGASSALTSVFSGGGGGAGITAGNAVPRSADGNVFTSPSVTSIAERGESEAVLPLERRNGRLGVRAGSGGTNVTVNIINEGGEQLEQRETRQREGPNGEQQIDVVVKSSIERLDGRGQLDGVFNRHGAPRRGQR